MSEKFPVEFSVNNARVKPTVIQKMFSSRNLTVPALHDVVVSVKLNIYTGKFLFDSLEEASYVIRHLNFSSNYVDIKLSLALASSCLHLCHKVLLRGLPTAITQESLLPFTTVLYATISFSVSETTAIVYLSPNESTSFKMKGKAKMEFTIHGIKEKKVILVEPFADPVDSDDEQASFKIENMFIGHLLYSFKDDRVQIIQYQPAIPSNSTATSSLARSSFTPSKVNHRQTSGIRPIGRFTPRQPAMSTNANWIEEQNSYVHTVHYSKVPDAPTYKRRNVINKSKYETKFKPANQYLAVMHDKIYCTPPMEARDIQEAD
ncbi:hypothetical protein HK096_011332, partial [Nowakowskiella sp. JEL0078]